MMVMGVYLTIQGPRSFSHLPHPFHPAKVIKWLLIDQLCMSFLGHLVLIRRLVLQVLRYPALLQVSKPHH